jgi:hypothetical protein
MGFAPVTTDDLLQGVQWRAAGRFPRKIQYQALSVRPALDFKPDGPKETAARAKLQLPLACQLMDIQTRTLHVTELAL